MRERLDCAVFEGGNLTAGYMPEAGIYANGRLHLHRVGPPCARELGVHALAVMAPALQRYDVCLLGVSETNLAWVRQSLLAAMEQLRTPIMGLIGNLKAPAIDDLYTLGMADFLRHPACPEEIRIRTERLLDRLAQRRTLYPTQGAAARSTVSEASTVYPGSKLSAPSTQPALEADEGGEHGDAELEAFAAATAVRCAVSSDSFGDAKSKVIACFERAYLHASLTRSSGNIAMAARNAKKHRRAYWALMRKYGIDAAPFRKGLPSDE